MRNLKLINQSEEGLGSKEQEHIWAGRKMSLEEFQKRRWTPFVPGHPHLLLGGSIT